MPGLTDKQEQLCAESRWDFSDLRAVYINCTLKRSPGQSHTQGLADRSIAIMERNGVSVEVVRAVDHTLAPGVQPDMTEHGFERDDWPQIFERVMAADILVLTSPIWLGEKSSVCTQVIERLYGTSHLLNDRGQYAYCGRVGGCLITGNEGGARHRGCSGGSSARSSDDIRPGLRTHPAGPGLQGVARPGLEPGRGQGSWYHHWYHGTL